MLNWGIRVVMVDLGTSLVAAEVAGGQEPTVVHVSQIGVDGSSWTPVTRLLTTGPRVVSYDRPGIGASPPRPAPNPPQPYSTFAAELATMLDHLGITRPVVAVGHSFGSLIIRMFAAQHPELVAGMVPVDGSVPTLQLWPGSAPDTDGDGLARQTNAELIIAADAGHQIPLEAPALVAFAIDEVVHAVRRQHRTVTIEQARAAAAGGLVRRHRGRTAP